LVSLLRCGDGGERRILVLDDVALGWGEDGWIGIALVKLLDLGGGSASPGIVADRHHGDVEIPCGPGLIDHDQGESVSFFTDGDRLGLPGAGCRNALKLPGAELFGLPLGHCGLPDMAAGGHGGDFGLGYTMFLGFGLKEKRNGDDNSRFLRFAAE
jgi:hypothetical protein